MFGKRIDDERWAQEVLELAELIEPIWDELEIAAQSVGEDPIFGWIASPSLTEMFEPLEKHRSDLERRYKGLGKPATSSDLLAAKRRLDESFGLLKDGLLWGKRHFKDAAGGPGNRAATEGQGLALKAATIRLTQNGMKFSEFTLAACQSGRQAFIMTHAWLSAYRPSSPGLADLFVSAAIESPVGKTMRVSDMAMLSAWCFNQAAILGMIMKDDHGPVLPSIWDPEREVIFWERCSELRFKLRDPRNLGYEFLGVQHPEIYGLPSEVAEGKSFSDLMKETKKLTQAKVSQEQARSEWAIATAMGFGYGVLAPDVVQRSMEAIAAGIDSEQYADARDNGLDVPEQQSIVPYDDQLDLVVEMCRPFFREHHPEAFEALRRRPL